MTNPVSLSRRLRAGLVLVLAPLCNGAAGQPREIAAGSDRLLIAPGEVRTWPLGELACGQTYRILAWVDQAPLDAGERVRVEIRGASLEPMSKWLHAGDPDLLLCIRPSGTGVASLSLSRDALSGRLPVAVRIDCQSLALGTSDRAAVEAEPNNTWRDANPLVLGRDVYGTADDVDYLENRDEGKQGLDWFRFEVQGPDHILVDFELELLDRDVSANLAVYTLNPASGVPEPYLAGKDPMEVIHDRERAALFQAHHANLHPGHILSRGQCQPPCLHPPHAGLAGAALR